MEFSQEDVLSTLKGAGSKGLKVKEIAHKLGARAKDVRRLRALVHDLESQGHVVRGRRKRYHASGEAGYTTGKVVGYGTRVFTLVPVDGTPDVRLSGDNLAGAAHGDTVVARVGRGQDGEREAFVQRVIERAPAELVGRLSRASGDSTISVERDRKVKSVDVDGGPQAEAGDYVVVKVDRWGEAYERARGRVVGVLGGGLTPGEDFAAIVKEFNLPLGFPPGVVREADAVAGTIRDEERKRRADLTGLLTFTIDPEDAKDFDDAISIEDGGSGSLRVGVHIADVSHYVRPHTELDREAMARGRSVYLVDRVIPMLPARLSSDLAALRPREPRLAVSVMMDINQHGEVGSYVIRDSVIESRARLDYAGAQALIDRPPTRGPGERKAIAEALERANELKRTLRQRRVGRGAIEIETPEVDIVVDSEGNAVDVRPVKRLESHDLIEELMILANETVADHMSYLGRQFIYRVHEVPDEADMEDLAVFAATFGHRFRFTRGTSPMALQSLLGKIKGRPEQYVVSMFLLRSLKKAVYSERNVGHFGLASKCYTHFTSPIRRYPDLLVHRLLKTYGCRKAVPEDGDGLAQYVMTAADIATVREIEGDEAERASIKAKVAQYMESRIGEEYWGIVTGVMDFGFFVMIEDNLIEGLVHVSTLSDDYYTRDSTGTMLLGSRGGAYYRVGERVRVKVLSVDRARREVDFMVIAKEAGGRGKAAPEPMSRSKIRKVFSELRREVERDRSAGRRRGRRVGGARPGRGRVTRSLKSRRLLRMRKTRRR